LNTEGSGKKEKRFENPIAVEVRNQRLNNGLPALGFDWFICGGITRSVQLNITGIKNIILTVYKIRLYRYSVKR